MDKKPIKICFVASADITVKYLLLSNIKFLEQKGYDVTVVCSKGAWIESLRAQGFNITTIGLKRNITPLFDIISLGRLWWYFRGQAFDIVHTYTPKPGLLGQLAARLAGVPLVFNTIFGFYFHEAMPPFKRALFVLIEKAAALFSTDIFFRNQEDFQTAAAEGIGKAGKRIYVGDGIDLLRFYPEKYPRETLAREKEKLGIAADAPVIGIVARMVKEKGYLVLFEAFKTVLEDFPKAVLVIVGPPDKEKSDSINAFAAAKFGIEQSTRFLGERTDVDMLYSLFDVFVLPSFREGFSHSIMEASAMAKPIVASDIRGCRGAVEHRVTGLLVRAKDAPALAEALIYMLSHPKEAAAMGDAAREKAKKEFNEQYVFEKTERAYRQYINR